MVGLTKKEIIEMDKNNVAAIRKAISKNNWSSVQEMIAEDALNILKQRLVNEIWKTKNNISNGSFSRNYLLGVLVKWT